MGNIVRSRCRHLTIIFAVLAATSPQLITSAEQCVQRSYLIVGSAGGSPLLSEQMISNHSVEHPVRSNCNLLCYMEPKCVGFNFNSKINEKNAPNCQLAGSLIKKNETFTGDWTLFVDVDAMKKQANAASMTPTKMCTLNGTGHMVGETWNETVCKNCTCHSNFSVTCTEAHCCECQGGTVPVQVSGQCCEECVLTKNCADLYKAGKRQDGSYAVDPDGLGSFDVWCDMTTDGGGWAVFQRRVDGSVDFFREWSAYKLGFGALAGNFWLGLDKIHRLADSGANVLRIDMTDFDNVTIYVKYNSFDVASEQESYKLNVALFEGTAGVGDALNYHNGMKFSTKDRKNDRWGDSASCAQERKGGWWYNACTETHLNGLYKNKDDRPDDRGIYWHRWKNDQSFIKKVEMKMRPSGF